MQRLLVCLLFVVLAAACLRLCWLADDAFITLRSVANLQAGHGPVWNLGERVQTFTHPLWFLLLSLVTAITQEHQLTAMVLCLLLSLGAAALLCRSGGAAAAVPVLLLLLGSRAYVDYSSSGLETALVMLLAAALLAAHGSSDPAARLRRVALVTGLAATTRLDLAVLCLPVLAAAWWRAGARRGAMPVALGLSPLLSWTAFAIVYYGSPFPITAHAKAFSHGVPAADLAACGLHYFARHATHDPVTLAAILLAITLGLRGGAHGCRAPAAGLLLYQLYLVRIGGDYMLGRFLVPGFPVAVGILSRTLFVPATALRSLWTGSAIALSWLVAGLPAFVRPIAADVADSRNAVVPPDGLVDERLFSYAVHGLWAPDRRPLVAGGLTAQLRPVRQSPVIAVYETVGGVGYWAGELVHIVDPMLCDPLLMRLPLADPQRWRIGHFARAIPAGYLETLATGTDRIPHQGLARYHEALRTVIQAPVWSQDRWRTMLRFWLGHYDAGLAEYVAADYREPPRQVVPLADLAAPPPPGALWFDSRAVRSARSGGLAVMLERPGAATALTLHVTPDCRYRVALRRGGAEVHAAELPLLVEPGPSLLRCTLPVPESAAAFDAIWIDVLDPPPATAVAMVGCLDLGR